MNELSPNSMWEKLGCTIERTIPNPKRPHVALRTVTDSLGRVVSCHPSGDAGYNFEHSVASWLLIGGM